MTTYIIMLVCLVPVVVMAIAIAKGKGDWLIAGYNTASKENKEKVNIKRLRIATSVFILITCAWCLLMPLTAHNKTLEYILLYAIGGITVIFLILANTWCKKK